MVGDQSPEEGPVLDSIEEMTAVMFKINRGEGTPVDLERYLSLGGAYYRAKAAEEGAKEDNRAAIGVAKLSMDFNSALEGGTNGRMMFCVRRITERLELSQDCEGRGQSERADRYREQAVNWAGLMQDLPASSQSSQPPQSS